NKEGESYTQTHNAWFSLGTQMSYMFVIVMSISCAFYIFRNKFREAIPCMLFMFGCFIMLFFRSTNEQSTYFMFEVLIVIAGCGLNHMYRNHHPEFEKVAVVTDAGPVEVPVENENQADWKAISRARALIFSGPSSKNTTPSAPAAPAAQPAEPAPVSSEPAPQPSGGSLMSLLSGRAPSSPATPSAAPIAPAAPVAPVKPAAPAKPAPKPAPSMMDSNPYTQATISPEGFFSFFTEEPEPVQPVYEEPEPEPVQTFEEAVEEAPVYENVNETAVSDTAGEATAYEEPVYEEPTYEEPIYEEPVYEEPVYEEPSYGAAAQEPAGEAQGYDGFQDLYEGPIQEFEEEEELGGADTYSKPAQAKDDSEQEYVMPEMTYMDPEESNIFGEPDAEDDEPLPPSHIFGRLMDEKPEPVKEQPQYEEPAPVYEELKAGEGEMVFDEGLPDDMAQFFTTAEPAPIPSQPEPEAPAPVYEAPMQSYEEPVSVAPVQAYTQPVNQAPAQTYNAPVNEAPARTYSEPAPYYAKNTSNPDPDTKSSYGAAAHALGFSFGSAMFGGDEGGFGGQFNEGLDEFSFGEGMPDLSSLDQAAALQQQGDGLAKKKKVVKKKIVRKVVKKPVSPLPGIKLDEIDLGAAFDEAHGTSSSQDDGSGGDYVIEI
ncbi:MAG: hypothetical protein K6E63_04035, partial [Lachnospiraceae bacterium]|nr:hypothetical protein [Lachnospiraceae bacterium]